MRPRGLGTAAWHPERAGAVSWSANDMGTPPASATPARDPRPEGLDWLGHAPGARAPIRLRVVAAGGRLVLRLAGLQVSVEGLEHAPAAGSIVACAMHRSWIDAPLLVAALPLQPRIWYLGSGEATFKSHSREAFMRWLGGILPVYRGGTDIDVHIESARAVIDAGALFGIFPEGTRAGDPMTPREFRRGIGLISLRTGAPIVPVAMAGTAELYRGRRIGLRILDPVSALDLAGITVAPAPGSAAELYAARAVTAALQALLTPAAESLARWTDDPPSVRRRWLWMSKLFR
jgi:1-acyl-sn-glycerol-3-phosphate acyltransferase